MSSSSETAGQAQAVRTQAGLLGEEDGGGSGRLQAEGAGWWVGDGWVEGAAPGSKVREKVKWRQEEDLTPLFRPPLLLCIESVSIVLCCSGACLSDPFTVSIRKTATTHVVR